MCDFTEEITNVRKTRINLRAKKKYDTVVVLRILKTSAGIQNVRMNMRPNRFLRISRKEHYSCEKKWRIKVLEKSSFNLYDNIASY